MKSYYIIRGYYEEFPKLLLKFLNLDIVFAEDNF